MQNSFATIVALIKDRQNRRILRLSFPHNDGPDAVLLVNRLEADESLSRDFRFTLELLSDDAHISLKSMMGKMVSVALVRGDGGLRYFNGYVFEFGLLKTDGGTAFYSMVLQPWLAYLRLREDNYLFHNQTLREQTATVFQDYGAHPDWDCQLGGPDPAMTMACQFGESDYNYLHRRWEAAGWHYRYEHTESGHKLVLSDDSTVASPIDGDGAVIAFQRHAGSRVEEALGEWSPARRIAVGKVSLTAFDFKAAKPKHIEISTLHRQGKVPRIEFYRYAGAYGFGANFGDGNHQARLRMEEIEAGIKQMEGKGNNPYGAPGRWFRLNCHFHFDKPASRSDREKNQFLIVGMRHEVANNYLAVDGVAEYRNELTCVRKSVPWRPGPGFNSNATKILAPQTALVVATEGAEIETDQYGRAKVQFHWDRAEPGHQHRSTWLRMMRPAAGATQAWGGVVRNLQEVVISWLGGDPDAPFIMGCVPNAVNMPPWSLPSQQALSGIRSRELKGANNGGGRRSNHLVLDDTSGEIQAQLKSDHLHSQLSLGHISRIEDTAGRKDRRGEGFALETEGAGALRSAKGLLLTTDGRSQAVGGTLSRDELVHCLEQALALAKGLGGAAGAHAGGQRDLQPQQGLSAAVDALGHGAGEEAEAAGAAPSAQPVIALSAAAGIASATPKDQLHYAGENIDTVAGKNQQHYAARSILHTAGRDIEQFSLDGDLRSIAAKGKVGIEAQQNELRILARKMLQLISEDDWLELRGKKGIRLHGADSLLEISDVVQLFTRQPALIHGNLETLAPKSVAQASNERPSSMYDQEVRLLQVNNMPAPHIDYEVVRDGGDGSGAKTGAGGSTQVQKASGMESYTIRYKGERP